MNNIIKKISAFAMAFTLLGAGGSIASNVKDTNTGALTVSAAVAHTCGQFTYMDHMEKSGCSYYRVYKCRVCNKQTSRVFDHTSHGSTYRKEIRSGHYEKRTRVRYIGTGINQRKITEEYTVWVPAVYGTYCCDCNARIS